METDYTKIKYTREWFDNPKNQAHTIYDIVDFKVESCDNIIHVGDHFILDLYPIYENGEDRDFSDVEIWEVKLTDFKHYDKRRREKFNFVAIQKVTTGKQFGYPNGYWKVKNETEGAIPPKPKGSGILAQFL